VEVKPGYKQTEVGVIPEEWECHALDDSIDLLTGYPFPSSGYSNSGVRLLRCSNVNRGVTNWSEEATRFWPKVTLDIRRYVLKAGDIVVAMDGSLVGRSFAMLSENDLPAILLQRVARIRSECIKQKFLKAWICSDIFTKHCDSVKTITAIPHISPADIKSFIIAIPPTLAEQEAIAEALSDADTLIESLDQLIAKKRNLKEGAMQELLTGKKRLPEFSGEWEMKQLGEIAFVNKGSQLHIVDASEHGRFAHLNGGITPSGYTDKSNTPANTIAISEGGNSCGYVQFMFEPFWCGGHCYAVIPNGVDNNFLFHALKENESSIMRLRVGSGLPNIQKNDLLEFELRCPTNHDEQTAIATILSDMDTEIAELEAKLAKVRQIRQGMMQELLTGRIRLV